MSSRVHGYLPEIAIATAAILYGSTFTIVQDALDDLTPSGLNVFRFALGAAVLAPFALTRSWRGPEPRPTDSRRTLFIGALAIGAVATGAYFCQNLGLQHTTTSNSAFITGLFAVTTPVIESIVFRHSPRRAIWVAVVMSVFGLFLLTGAEPSLGFGDGVTVGTAVLFGFWFVLIGVFTNRVDVIGLTALQLGVVAVLSLPVALIEGFGTMTSEAVLAIVLTGIGCSAIAFSLSVWAQRAIDPSPRQPPQPARAGRRRSHRVRRRRTARGRRLPRRRADPGRHRRRRAGTHRRASAGSERPIVESA